MLLNRLIGLVLVALACGGRLAMADDARHWAFQPVVAVEVPVVDDASNAIDAFIRHRLAQEALTPSDPAEAPTLLRRLHLDLTGLPPTAGQVEKFLADPSRIAFANVIDQLLASRSYGERWGRRWLDVARYADAKGYVDAGELRYPFAYTYRDYVIEAFQADLPFDRFIREQLAADRLVEPTQTKPLAALGFLTVGSRYNFFPHEIIDDRIDVVTRGFLGLTASCARCHDHKFDPVSAADYYSLYAVFGNSREPTLDQSPRIGGIGAAEDEAFEKKLAEVVEKHRVLRLDLHDKMRHEMRAWAGDYLRYIVQSDPNHRSESQPMLRTKRGLIRERSAYASGAVVRWQRYLESREEDDPVWGIWVRLANVPRKEVAQTFTELRKNWGEHSPMNRLVKSKFDDASEIPNLAAAADIYGALLEGIDARWRERIAADPAVIRFTDEAEEQLRQVLYGEGSPAVMHLDESSEVYTLDESVEARKSFANIEKMFLERRSELAPRPMLLVDKEEPIQQRIFVRGDPLQTGELAPRTIPASLTCAAPVPVTRGSGRLELAESIARADHPLTARVIVNRVWAWHFGRGLVATPSDFGTRSDLPSHPELLDFLARWLVEHDWSLKQLHRLILTSKTWQQSSRDRPDCRAIDPENRLLWRANRQRLDFETMRDAMLHVSGQLESHSGGPPVEKAPDDPANRHRSVYTYIDREKLAEIYRVFDFPSPDISAPGRTETTVPQQALFLLNSPFVLAQGDAIEKLAQAGPGDPVQIVYRRIFARDPSQVEAEGARDLVDDSPDGLRQLAQALLISNEFLFAD
jgi:hypothetical protein